MQVLTFEENGKTKRVERVMVLRCRCGDELSCPPDQDDWGWVRSQPALQFAHDHVGHGTVAAHLRFIEKD